MAACSPAHLAAAERCMRGVLADIGSGRFWPPTALGKNGEFGELFCEPADDPFRGAPQWMRAWQTDLMSRCLAISASAGSGKTYQLAHRYIGLLLHDVEPDRIVALTFSRKAAAEIFDSIIKYLVEAALSPASREELGRMTGFAELGSDRMLVLLRRLLSRLHRLQIGTLDSFAVRLLTCFPMELGIDYGFELIDNDGASAKLLRRDVLLRLLGAKWPHGKRVSGDFFEAFRLATFGREERRLSDLLQQFIEAYQDLYLQMPDKSSWGKAARIWPAGAFWQGAPTAIGDLAAELRALVESELPARVQRRWLEFVAEVEAHRVGRPLPRGMTYFLERIAPVLPDLLRGEAELAMDRVTYSVRGQICRLLLDHIGYLLAMELKAACQKTGAIYEVIRYYENLYDATVRRRGRLTFNDVHFLLGPGKAPGSRQYTLSSQAGADRLLIDYRLDARIDHWLLDEFQDTSTLQWEVLANLIDEVVQDSGGDRSFFYVGDVKQAIYRWRRGNADLSGRFCGTMAGRSGSFPSTAPTVPVSRSSIVSTRCSAICRPICRSGRSWIGGRSGGRMSVPRAGYPPSGMSPCWSRNLIRLLKSRAGKNVTPWWPRCCRKWSRSDRNLSVAVLVRKNSQGRDLVQFLRANCPTLAVVHEGNAEITDNPVCSLLLSLVRYAVHPGDSLACIHLQMSPLDSAIRTGKRVMTGLPLLVLGQIRAYGFRGCLARWGEVLRSPAPWTGSARKNLPNCLHAAEQFDAPARHLLTIFWPLSRAIVIGKRLPPVRSRS